MKFRRSLIQLYEIIDNFSKITGGVFSYAELSNIIGSQSPLQNSRTISRLTREGVLSKICRGFYVAKNFDLWMLTARLEPKATISMDSLLAREGLIGTVPKNVSATVSGKRKRRILTNSGDILIHSIRKELDFGVVTLKNGIQVATPEKAYLDLLYFYQKGTRFVINPLQEVDILKLNRKWILKHLANYKNPKFVQFVKGLLYDRNSS